MKAQELGHDIYSYLIEDLFSPQSAFSYEKLLYEELGFDRSKKLPKKQIMEVIAGALFGAELAMSKRFDSFTMGNIMRGISEEMLIHVEDLGFNKSDIDSLELLCFNRLDQYFNIFSSVFTINVTLGKHFYWNIIGRETDCNFERIQRAFFFIFNVHEFVKEFLNKLLNEVKVV